MSTLFPATTSDGETHASLEGYYRLHGKIYDATRWTFLFGRHAILREVAARATPRHILEVGCGTGKNLDALGRLFPHAQLTGVDLSSAMLERARRKTAANPRVQLVHRPYDADFATAGSYDLILFSYALTMFNPGFEDALAAAQTHLRSGGLVAVVDFHDTRWPGFARWMAFNHVRMDAQLRPLLTGGFDPILDTTPRAYGGVWRYLMYIGRKK